MATSIAVLSNVNVNTIVRILDQDADLSVYHPEGYGNELGLLLNPESTYHVFAPRMTFLIPDLMELLRHELEPERAGSVIRKWFADLEGALPEGSVCYISDACLWGEELAVLPDVGRKERLEGLWLETLTDFASRHAGVRIFPYRSVMEGLGEEAFFSRKMWYLGKIIWTGEASARLAEQIRQQIRVELRSPKKVLVLDLDNTLWGGLAGEHDREPIRLSEDHAGLAYKNLQRVLLQMQMQGVLLAIASKNNEADAEELLRRHPHMVLRPECFAAKRISWEPKHESIASIAEELNLGLESFVFWDDSPAERELVSRMLPQVTVPDFPDRPEDLARAMAQIHRDFFAKAAVTEEDRNKTAQYAANAERKKLEEGAGSFEEYLESLAMEITEEDPKAHVERLTQLLNKTNQFNLTTRRHEQAELEAQLVSPDKKWFLYRVRDRFGDNGIVAALLLDMAGETPVIAEFVMSCRVMGRRLEETFLSRVEQYVREAGYAALEARYCPTPKNAPVAGLYDRVGYRLVAESPDGSRAYRRELS